MLLIYVAFSRKGPWPSFDYTKGCQVKKGWVPLIQMADNFYFLIIAMFDNRRANIKFESWVVFAKRLNSLGLCPLANSYFFFYDIQLVISDLIRSCMIGLVPIRSMIRIPFGSHLGLILFESNKFDPIPSDSIRSIPMRSNSIWIRFFWSDPIRFGFNT